jgi:hypothetical protein
MIVHLIMWRFFLALTNDDGSVIHLTNNQPSAYQMISKAAIS